MPRADRARRPAGRHLRLGRGRHRRRRPRRGAASRTWWPRRPGPGCSAASAASAGCFAFDTGRYARPVLVSSTDGVGTKLAGGPGHRPLRHRRASTWWPCASTTWSASGPSRCSCSTTWRSGKLVPEQMEALVAGVADGCRQAGCALLGRRDGRAPRGHGAPTTSTWPASPWGRSSATPCSGPTGCAAGDVLVGLASPGLRSNGYSLARHVLLERAGLALDGPAWAGAPTTRWPTSCSGPR